MMCPQQQQQQRNRRGMIQNTKGCCGRPFDNDNNNNNNTQTNSKNKKRLLFTVCCISGILIGTLSNLSYDNHTTTAGHLGGTSSQAITFASTASDHNNNNNNVRGATVVADTKHEDVSRILNSSSSNNNNMPNIITTKMVSSESSISGPNTLDESSALQQQQHHHQQQQQQQQQQRQRQSNQDLLSSRKEATLAEESMNNNSLTTTTTTTSQRVGEETNEDHNKDGGEEIWAPKRVEGWKDKLQHWNTWAQNKTITTNKPGAWIHVGKSGGTTLRAIVAPRRWGRRKPDSVMAKLVGRCHMEECDDMSNYQFLVWLIRDPYARTGSAFEYMHPANKLSPKRLIGKYVKSLGRCFHSYEEFAYYLDDSSKNHNNENSTTATATATSYNNNNNDNSTTTTTTTTTIIPQESEKPKMQSKAKTCYQHAYDLLHHNIPDKGGHLYWDTGYWVNKVKKAFNDIANGDDDKELLSSSSSSSSSSPLPYMLVIRSEHMWSDYKMVNWLLGQDWTTIKTHESDAKIGKDYSERQYPVTRNLTAMGKHRLCNALDREYQDYFWVLQHAANIGPNDLQDALNLAHRNCPNVTIR